eukprot:bmy_10745T0
MTEEGEFTVYGKSPPCTVSILRHGGHGKGAASVSGRALHPDQAQGNFINTDITPEFIPQKRDILMIESMNSLSRRVPIRSELYLDNRKEIRTILSELAPDLPSYHSLEWRLDVQLASRSLRQQMKPSVTIKLHLNQNGDHNTQVLQTDPATLLHLVQQLEQALEEMKTNHCRRVVRNIK